MQNLNVGSVGADSNRAEPEQGSTPIVLHPKGCARGFALLEESDFGEQMDSVVMPVLRAVKQDDWLKVETESVNLTGDDPRPVGHRGIHSVFFDQRRFMRELDERNEHGVSEAADMTAGAAVGAQSTQGDVAEPSAVELGTVVISHGFTESALKYAEMSWYFLQAGFNVLIVEHRGHGRSLREAPNPDVVTMANWHHYVSDFVGAVRQAVARFDIAGPLKLFAHSLGGAIGTAVIEDYPDLFSRVVLSSPMMTPKTGMPNWLAYGLSEAFTKAGKGFTKVPLMPVFSEEFNENKTGGRSQARVKWYHERKAENESYRTNAPSFNWVVAALRMDHTVTKAENVRRITAPILIFQAGDDKWVRASAETDFVKAARGAGVPIRAVRFPGSAHEIFSEPNDVLARYLPIVLEFLAD